MPPNARLLSAGTNYDYFPAKLGCSNEKLVLRVNYHDKGCGFVGADMIECRLLWNWVKGWGCLIDEAPWV